MAISRHGRVINSAFRGPPWLRNPHLQTIWPTLFARPKIPEYRFEQFELADGDFIDVGWTVGRSSGPLVLILHGLEGSYRSPYVHGLTNVAIARGWRAAVVHFRGCGPRPNRLDRTYHSGETRDFASVLKAIRAREPHTPLFAVGYSLGGNALLKWLGECGAATQTGQQTNPTELRGAVAISVPMRLDIAADHLNKGLSRIYQWWLLRSLKRKVLGKFGGRADPPIDLKLVRTAASMRAFDDAVTAPLHGFRDATHYYEQSSSRQYLKTIRTPTLIVHAQDDPFMTPAVIPSASELSDAVTLELATHGGHVGFVAERPRTGHGSSRFWIETRATEFLESLAEL